MAKTKRGAVKQIMKDEYQLARAETYRHQPRAIRSIRLVKKGSPNEYLACLKFKTRESMMIEDGKIRLTIA